MSNDTSADMEERGFVTFERLQAAMNKCQAEDARIAELEKHLAQVEKYAVQWQDKALKAEAALAAQGAEPVEMYDVLRVADEVIAVGDSLTPKSTAKHTPGPWKVNFSKFSEVKTMEGALIATCNKLDGLVNLQANAQLVAAAPELLDIAQRLADIEVGLVNGNSASEITVCALAAQASAIIRRLGIAA